MSQVEKLEEIISSLSKTAVDLKSIQKSIQKIISRRYKQTAV